MPVSLAMGVTLSIQYPFHPRVLDSPSRSGGRTNIVCAVRSDHKNIWEIAEDFEAIYKQKSEVHSLGSLHDLYETMHKTRAMQPHNMWAWMSLFYTYYSLNGQTTLPQLLDNTRFPGVKDYFAQTPLERLGKW